jgi:small-conductance mechanosensitive channel
MNFGWIEAMLAIVVWLTVGLVLVPSFSARWERACKRNLQTAAIRLTTSDKPQNKAPAGRNTHTFVQKTNLIYASMQLPPRGNIYPPHMDASVTIIFSSSSIVLYIIMFLFALSSLGITLLIYQQDITGIQWRLLWGVSDRDSHMLLRWGVGAATTFRKDSGFGYISIYLL